MKSLRITKIFITSLVVLMLTQVTCFAGNLVGFVDLSFSINSKYYFSKGIQKQLEVAPFIEDGSTLVPFRVIFEELGYSIEWNNEDSSVVASAVNSTIKLKMNSKIAKVNETEKELTVAPKIVNGKAVVPLRFIAENANSNINWDEKTKSIFITRSGRYDTGKIMLYEKKSDGKNVVHLYEKANLKIVTLENRELINWYAFKGKVLATIFDKTKNQNNFTIFNGEKFSTLIDDFEIKDTFEFNDNLLIHGYDRGQKYNKLYRFDGKKLILVQNNFYVGKRIAFKDKLVINKYDNTRNYTLLAFDKNSWNPGTLASGYIIKDTIERDDVLYMMGSWQQGKDITLAAYEGKDTSQSSFIRLSNTLNVDLSKAVSFNRKLYIINGSELTSIDKSGVYKILIPYDSTTFINYSVNMIKVYNGKLIVGIAGAKAVDYLGKSKSAPIKISPQIAEFEEPSRMSTLIDNFTPLEFRLEDNELLIVGTEKETTDYVLYILKGRNLYRTLDVTKIIQAIRVSNKLFIDVMDKDRMSGKPRNTLIFFDGQNFINLATGMETKKWANVDGSLVIGGFEQDINTNRLYAYTSTFENLLSNINIKYWYQSSDALFINGNDPGEKTNNFYKFVNKRLIKLFENIEVVNIIKVKGKYFLIHAYNRDSKSPLNSKKVLYLYNDANGDFIEMKGNVDITQMLFVE